MVDGKLCVVCRGKGWRNYLYGFRANLLLKCSTLHFPLFAFAGIQKWIFKAVWLRAGDFPVSHANLGQVVCSFV